MSANDIRRSSTEFGAALQVIDVPDPACPDLDDDVAGVLSHISSDSTVAARGLDGVEQTG